MKESVFQKKLIKELQEKFPESIILKTDPNYIQGFPDLLMLFKDKWLALEVKRTRKAHHQPNQDYYISKLNKMSFASFIFPENKKETIKKITKFLEVK